VALIAVHVWERRQPAFAAYGPEFVGRPELIRRIERTEIDFDLVAAAPENGRPAARAKMTSRVVPGFSLDRNRSLGEYRRSVKQRAVMLAAVEAMADADPIWPPRRFEANIAAQASAHDLIHDAPPRRSFSGMCKAGFA